MSKKIKITEAQFSEFVQQEAKKRKRIYELKEKRSKIIQQLNEMYADAGMSADIDMEEISLGQGVKNFFLGSREEWKRKYLEWMTKMQAHWAQRGKTIQIPTGQDLEDAVTAVQKAGDVQVVKRDGKWVPVKHVSVGVADAFTA